MIAIGCLVVSNKKKDLKHGTFYIYKICYQ